MITKIHREIKEIISIAIQGNVDEVRRLIKACGSKRYARALATHAFAAAAEYSRPDRPLAAVAREALAHGADLSESGPYGLWRAVNHGDTEMTRVLVDAGITLKMCEGFNPFSDAVSNGFCDIARLLFENGLGPESISDIDLVSVYRQEYYAAVALLVEHGADYTELPRFGKLTRERAIQKLTAQAVAKELGT